MNKQLRTILLTTLTLSALTIALIEISGISRKALFNKYGIGKGTSEHPSDLQLQSEREEKVSKLPKTTISFDESKYKFGTIKEGAVVKHAFRFRNTGTQPLMIAEVIATCGCTIPTYSKEPVLPGKDGTIVVEFHSAGKTGVQQKSIFVVANTQPEKTPIGFEATVK